MHMSLSEILLVLLVALLVLKPEQLPDVARTLGKWARVFKQSIDKIKQEMLQ